MEMIWVWLAVVVVSLIIEFFTWDLTSIWFAFAGLVSLVLSIFDSINWIWQLSVFIVLSALLIIFVRQICRKLLLKSDEKTNVDAFIGKRAKLLTAVGANGECGTVKFNGITWNVISEADAVIKEGCQVEIIRVEGNKMIVKEVVEDKKDSDTDNQSKEQVSDIGEAKAESDKDDSKKSEENKGDK